MLRDKNIEFFDEPSAQTPKILQFKMEDMMNLECVFASHNLIKDCFGVSKCTTLLEVNLSFNQITDITPLSELTMLEKLHLNRNKINMIDAIRHLGSLQVVGLFHNEIFDPKSTLDILVNLGRNYKLRDIAIDGNPITSTVRFKN